MIRKTKKMVEELKTKLIDKGIDVNEFEEYFKGIESNLKDKKYGLVWENHTEEIETELLTKFPILKEEKELRVLNTEEGLTNNFLIEGDNLESLTALKNMGKKVDVIYIDPPYNTGNRDFIYEDRYVDSEDGYRHSKWLSFMEKRLKLAKDLLTEDGVIFVSIDDNEQANLKLLCDSVFGERNFVANMVWKKSNTVKNDNKGVSIQTESVLMYSKMKEKVVLKNRPLDETYIKNSYRYEDTKGVFRTVQLYKHKNPKKFKVVSPTGKEWEKPWNYNEEGFKRLIDNDLVYWGKEGQGVPSKKVYLKDSKGRGNVNFYDGEEFGYSGKGTKDLLDVMGESNTFSYPKPVNLIKELVRMKEGESLTILDFFAGSGTTGHAVLEYNKENRTSHNFILCTNNENNICKDVTYQRLNKVINGYTTPKGKEVEGIPSNLTYLKIELIEKEDDLVDFEVSEELLESMVNNLKVLHNISNTINLKEGRLTKLVGENKDFYLYENFYIDSDDFEGIELDSNKTNIVYVKEENLTDVELDKFDEVISLEDLVRF